MSGWPAGGVLVIAGPTAAGKTAFAVRLAAALGGEIVSADSRQIYQGLEIGAGKPSAAELAAVPHHLVSAASPRTTVTAAGFASRVDAVRADLAARGKRCLLVGGTGLWIRAAVDGLAPTPPPDPALRARLAARADAEGEAGLFEELRRADPETAARLHPADRVRVFRALEIFTQTGTPPSRLRGPGAERFPTLWLGVSRPRAELYARAEARIALWLAAGWKDEVRDLLAAGLTADAPALRALGYSHLARHLAGELAYDETVELIRRDTRRYIKRQQTWFLAEPRMHWLDLSAGEDAAHAAALKRLRDAGWIG